MKPILLLVFSAVLRFPAILTVAQPDIGAIAGQTASWTFQASADPAVYLTFTGSFLLFETNPSIGTYMDSIGAWGGPVNFALPPASGIWSDVLGSLSIDATVRSRRSIGCVLSKKACIKVRSAWRTNIASRDIV